MCWITSILCQGPLSTHFAFPCLTSSLGQPAPRVRGQNRLGYGLAALCNRPTTTGLATKPQPIFVVSLSNCPPPFPLFGYFSAFFSPASSVVRPHTIFTPYRFQLAKQFCTNIFDFTVSLQWVIFSALVISAKGFWSIVWSYSSRDFQLFCYQSQFHFKNVS